MYLTYKKKRALINNFAVIYKNNNKNNIKIPGLNVMVSESENLIPSNFAIEQNVSALGNFTYEGLYPWIWISSSRSCEGSI